MKIPASTIIKVCTLEALEIRSECPENGPVKQNRKSSHFVDAFLDNECVEMTYYCDVCTQKLKLLQFNAAGGHIGFWLIKFSDRLCRRMTDRVTEDLYRQVRGSYSDSISEKIKLQLYSYNAQTTVENGLFIHTFTHSISCRIILS